jgi:hypothetical protein
VIPFNEPAVENASANSFWLQTTETDFTNGTLDNLTVTAEGNLTLTLQEKYVTDDFIDESKIGSKRRAVVDTDYGEVRLNKFNKLFGGGLDDMGLSVNQTADGGYIIAGHTNSYSGGDFDAWLIKTDTYGNKIWDKLYGGSGSDTINEVLPTSDGGYIIIGTTQSYGGSDDDVWLIKTNATGVEQWNKTFGGSSADQGVSIEITSDNGYIFSGNTMSFNPGNWDFWLIKTNETGIEQWNETFGGGANDECYEMDLTSDGGFVLVGYTESYGGSDQDVWLVKANDTGSEQWNMTFGGSQVDRGWTVQQTSDGGYIIGGETDSYDTAGGVDAWLIKTDSNGNSQWNKVYGGSWADYFFSVVEKPDGGYILSGQTLSYGAGNWDAWLVETNWGGDKPWYRLYGGSSDDIGRTVQETADGGIVMVAQTESFGAGGRDIWLIKTNSLGNDLWEKVYGGGSNDYGYYAGPTSDGSIMTIGETYFYDVNGDVWLIMTNATGQEKWNKTYGGSSGDRGYSVLQASDGGYLIVGHTGSYGASGYNVWIVKTNDTGDEEWNNTIGGDQSDHCYSARMTSDGGYIIIGYTQSYGAGNYDVWLVKINSTGEEQWNKTFGGGLDDYGRSVWQTSDGGFIITGETDSFGYGGTDLWMIKTNETGDEEWNICRGWTLDDHGYSVQETADGGFIFTGIRTPSGTNNDIWLIKTNSTGSQEWEKIFDPAVPGWSDKGYSVRQTPDGGYIVTGYTLSYSMSYWEGYLLKTDSSGNEQWFKMFTRGNNNYLYSVELTNNGGYIATGHTTVFSASDDVWLIKDDTSWGEAVSNNLLSGIYEYAFNNFTCEVVEPPKTAIRVQFSEDNITWYNSTGSLNGWDELSDGSNLINLTSLGWSSSEFYYRVNLFSDGPDTPVLSGVNLSYEHYFPAGSLESKSFDSGGNITWQLIDWNATIPPGTEIRFQLRSAATEGDLASKNFTGHDGTPMTNYTIPMTPIWTGHGNDPWIQFKAYLITTKESATPILHDVIIYYNLIPGQPILTAPSNDVLISNNTPGFHWTFIDSDSAQAGFQVLIDDDVGFGSIDYDSGQQSSSITNWQFPVGTGYTTIADGTWYWKVRTNDSDGDWSQYSNVWNFTVDATPPNDFVPTADPPSWTNGTQPIITFSTTDDLSGMDHYEISNNSVSFSTQSSPYTLPSLSDGVHNITVRAFDVAGNYLDRWVDVYIDTTPPLNFTPVATPSNWTNNTTPVVTFSTTDVTTSVDHYEVSINGTPFTVQTSPYTLPPQTDGIYNITVRAYDIVNNYQEAWVDIYIDTVSPDDFTPIANPSTWAQNTQPEITFSTTDDTSGVEYYEVRIDSEDFANQTSPYTLPSQPDGIHNITVRAHDRAGNYKDSYVDVYIDTNSPDAFTTTADPNVWTYDPQPVITFSTTDTPSDIDHFEVKIDSEGFSTQTSPYTLPVQSDGIHNITVRAFDFAGNSMDSYVDVYIDVTDPVDFTPYAPSGWIVDNQPEITFLTTDATSGIDHYEVRIDSQDFETQTSPYTLPAQSDGTHNITVRAYDRAGNYIDRYVEVHIDTTPPTITHTPVSTGNKDTNIRITATITDDQSGVDYAELYYKKRIDTKYTKIDMTKSGNTYSADIPATSVTVDGVDYYMKAADKATAPFVVYYGSGGQVTQEPTSQNDIIITISDIDVTPPTVIERFPLGNDVKVSTLISVTFNEVMDTTITENIISTTPGLTGTAHWEGNKLIFTSDFALEYGTQYTVNISTEARDLAGNNLEIGISWQFLTTSTQDLTPPTVYDEQPRGIDVPIDRSIKVTFSESMSMESTKNAFSIEPFVSGEFSWNTERTELTFVPDSPLSYDTKNKVTISTEAKDLVGNNMEYDHVWEFTTVKASEKDVGEESLWDVWEPIITGLTILVSLFVAIFGFVQIRKKRGKLRRYLEEIEEIYSENKSDPKTCEKELISLREEIKSEVTKGKVEEGHFLILDKKIDDHLKEIKAAGKGGIQEESSAESPEDEEIGEKEEEGAEEVEEGDDEPKEIEEEVEETEAKEGLEEDTTEDEEEIE